MPMCVRLTVGMDRVVLSRADQAAVRRPPPVTTAALALAPDLSLNGFVPAAGAVSPPSLRRLCHHRPGGPKQHSGRRTA